RDRSVEIVTVTTRGDELEGPLSETGEVGLFTSTLERALLHGSVDVAVHSLKDLPVADGSAVPVVAVPLRGDPADALVSRSGEPLAGLPAGAKIGTSSPRRGSMILAQRPDARVVPIRGNVDGRVRQLDEGHFDAIVLAIAGLSRLGLEDRVSERFDPRAFPPAPGQGALAVQARSDDTRLHSAVLHLDDPEARSMTSAERACLEALGGGCSRPLGVHAWREGETIGVAAAIGSLDGTKVVRGEAFGSTAEGAGRAAAEWLLRSGGEELLA
ncbi:MAG TPA: hydroxymethylbilane synthase, partial [Longimicrobiales bacterium]|nr:hydroxymethylbilane synthase [Longimicrobiales bacterium]